MKGRRRHIHLKYDFPYNKLEDLDYIIAKTQEFKKLEDSLNDIKKGIIFKIWLSKQYNRTGYSITLDTARFIKEDEVKDYLTKIFEKIGTPNRVYGEYKLIDVILEKYDKRLEWALLGSRRVV